MEHDAEMNEDEDTQSCDNCGGDGFVIICIDDICHGQGFCMHGDGERVCPVCKGEGVI